MFQVVYPLGQISMKMPDGWTLIKIRPNRYRIVKLDGKITVGTVETSSKKAVIKADENKDEGTNFWLAFGKLYPDLNPFTPCYGVVYPSENDIGTWELDELSRTRWEAIDELASYESKKDALFVFFFLGNFVNDKSLKVSAWQGVKETPITLDSSVLSTRVFKLAKQAEK